MYVFATVCVFKKDKVYLRQSCSSESSSQSLSPSHTQERRIHLPLSQWKSSGEQVGSTASKREQTRRLSAEKTNKHTEQLREEDHKRKKLKQHGWDVLMSL